MRGKLDVNPLLCSRNLPACFFLSLLFSLASAQLLAALSLRATPLDCILDYNGGPQFREIRSIILAMTTSLPPYWNWGTVRIKLEMSLWMLVLGLELPELKLLITD